MKYTKKEIQKRVSRNGKRINLKDFNWDSETKVFSSTLDSLILDFEDINNCSFNTGSDYIFKTGYKCNFETGSSCIFKTGSHCTFKTGSHCTFKTGYKCNFETGHNCTFKTYTDCSFKTSSHCTFNTYSDCSFDTGANCVVIRRGLFEVIILDDSLKYKLNPYKIAGFLTSKK